MALPYTFIEADAVNVVQGKIDAYELHGQTPGDSDTHADRIQLDAYSSVNIKMLIKNRQTFFCFVQRFGQLINKLLVLRFVKMRPGNQLGITVCIAHVCTSTVTFSGAHETASFHAIARLAAV